MEVQAAAQLEGDRLAVPGDLPARRDVGDDLPLRVLVDDALVERVEADSPADCRSYEGGDVEEERICHTDIAH